MTRTQGMRNGLTLTEVLVALMIFTAVIAIAMSIFNLWWRTYNRVPERVAIERELTSALEIIISRLRFAREVELVHVNDVPEQTTVNDIFIRFVSNPGKIEILGNKGASDLLRIEGLTQLYFSVLDDFSEGLLSVTISNATEDVSVSTTLRVMNSIVDGNYLETSAIRYRPSERFFASSSPDESPQPDPDPEDPEPEDPEPEPDPLPTLRASNISYSKRGQHLDLSITVLDQDNNAISGASLSIDLKTGGTIYDSVQAVTNNSGVAEMDFHLFFQQAPSGTYTTVVTNIAKEDYEWDGETPPNSYSK